MESTGVDNRATVGAVLLVALTVSCLSQLPLEVVPPLSQGPLELPVRPGAGPRILGRPALVWTGSEYLLAWRDERRSTPARPGRTSVFVTSVAAGTLGATLPGGLELPGSIGPASNELHLVATKTFSLLVASVNEDAGTKLYRWMAAGNRASTSRQR